MVSTEIKKPIDDSIITFYQALSSNGVYKFIDKHRYIYVVNGLVIYIEHNKIFPIRETEYVKYQDSKVVRTEDSITIILNNK